ncbi:hypothetical protein ZOD2009_15041 [Haladaptatus paucihalophilus DX253]|uniref:Uncharacterized protein n=1 Tax=Haladaptatus paucihalophilus DX253 TaxID=797209 RepID=E7QW20_HALPU|nr:hypothetical protein [Haladaptatus paucihalophilus]EFW91433.1 hypothetical protein ZOD2009_15041 [Haladaptatus paucihalophilus DX253]SHL00902.1 hypothetical protein SAMN05444342_2724 [Haladaptatus paucihalophilus DX253]
MTDEKTAGGKTTGGKTAGGKDTGDKTADDEEGVIRRIETALDHPLRLVGVWIGLSGIVNSVLGSLLRAWMIRPLPISPFVVGSIVTVFLAVPLVAYRPDVGFGTAFGFTFVAVVAFGVLNAIVGDGYDTGAGVSGSLYPVLDIALLWTAALLIAAALVVRTDG